MERHFLFDVVHKKKHEITDLFDRTGKGRFNLVNIGKKYISGSVFNITVNSEDKGYFSVRGNHVSLQAVPDRNTDEPRLALFVPPFLSTEFGSGVCIVRNCLSLPITPRTIFDPGEFRSYREMLVSGDRIYLGTRLDASYGPIWYYQTNSL